MSEWQQTTLDQLVKLRRGHDLPTSQRRQGNIPVVGAAGQSGWHDTAMAQAPGVVVGRAGASMGHASYCGTDFWPLNTAPYVTDFLGNHPRFVYYLLYQLDFSGFNSGAAQPMLNRNYITQIPVKLPSYAEQRSISEILEALEDKIALNNRIACTAEQLMTALADQQRWSFRVKVQELCELSKTQAVPVEMTEKEVDYYSLPAFDEDKTPQRVVPNSIRSNKFLIKEPSVLISKLNPNTPRVWDVKPSEQVPSLASTEFLVLVPRHGISSHCLWAVTSQSSFFEVLASTATGTSNSHQRVKPVDVLRSEVVDPRTIGDVSSQIDALAERVRNNRAENWVLTQLWDSLLPRLISGELRVKNAEKVLEEAT